MDYSLRKGQVALAAATLALAFVSSAAFAADVPSWCGPKKATLALLDGYGGNSWRLVTTASGKQEAEKCPSVTGICFRRPCHVRPQPTEQQGVRCLEDRRRSMS